MLVSYLSHQIICPRTSFTPNTFLPIMLLAVLHNHSNKSNSYPKILLKHNFMDKQAYFKKFKENRIKTFILTHTHTKKFMIRKVFKKLIKMHILKMLCMSLKFFGTEKYFSFTFQ